MPIEKIRGIVLGTVRHNDRHNVVTLFTRDRGRMAFLSPAAGGRSGRARNARLLPLSVIETDVNLRGNRELQLLGSVAAAEVWHDIYFNPVKSSLALFIAEFLSRYLRDSSPDGAAWDFILAAIRALDDAPTAQPNFHIWFLVRFLDFAGIAPDLTEYERGDNFDMQKGVPVAGTYGSRDVLTSAETALLVKLQRITLRNMRLFRFTGAERRLLLDRLLRYYAIHFPGLSGLKSPDILTELFSTPTWRDGNFCGLVQL